MTERLSAETRRDIAFTTGDDPEVYPSYVVVITRVADGTTRRIPIASPWHDDGSYFVWMDGNDACDCNRGRLFGDGDSPCGSDAYRVDAFEFPDGTSAQGDG
jgi:hypothetical protein